MDWVVDILIGWIIGSIVGGLLWDLATGGTATPTVGVLVGTFAGICLMRRRRWSKTSH